MVAEAGMLKAAVESTTFRTLLLPPPPLMLSSGFSDEVWVPLMF